MRPDKTERIYELFLLVLCFLYFINKNISIPKDMIRINDQ